MRAFVLMTLVATVLAGCNSRDDRILFDGQAFRGKATHESRDNRRSFVATVAPVSASIEGAREAGRYEAIKYCISEYGTSQIDWQTSPDAEPQTWAVERETVTFRGKCARL